MSQIMVASGGAVVDNKVELSSLDITNPGTASVAAGRVYLSSHRYDDIAGRRNTNRQDLGSMDRRDRHVDPPVFGHDHAKDRLYRNACVSLCRI